MKVQHICFLFFLNFIMCNLTTVDNQRFKVLKFVHWYSNYYNLDIDLKEDSSYYWSKNSKFIEEHNEKYYQILIRITRENKGDFWISYYYPQYESFLANKYKYYNISGQDTVNVNGGCKINCVKIQK
jgi:hypothetical protein